MTNQKRVLPKHLIIDCNPATFCALMVVAFFAAIGLISILIAPFKSL